MSVKVNYKGSLIGQLADDGILTLNTSGKYCEDNITILNGYQYPDIAIPNGYRKVQYLESSGTQYINTEILPVAGINVEIVAQLTPTALSSERTYIIGTTGAENSGRLQYSVTRGNIFIGYGGVSQPDDAEGINDSNIHVFSIINGVFYIDSVKVGGLNSSNFSVVKPIYLFALNNLGSVVRQTNGLRILKSKLYTNSAVLADCVPVCRNSDDKPFMYDYENGIFLPNAGTGEFVVGSDVE